MSEEIEESTNLDPLKPSPQRVFLDPSTPSLRSILRVVIVVLLVLWISSFLQNVISSLTYLLFIVVLAIFFAYFIEPLVRIIERPFEKRYSGKFMLRSLAIAISYLIVFSVLGIAVSYIAPIVSEQARDFTANLPNLANSIRNQINVLSRRFQRYNIPDELEKQISERITATVGEYGSALTTTIGSLAINTVMFLPWLVLIPILAFFFLKEAYVFRLSVLRVFPAGNWRIRVERIITDVNKTLRSYVRAQLLSCLIIGCTCTIGFYAIGLNYALLLGVLAAIFEFIPLIGPLTIGILSVTVAGFSNSSHQALITAGFLIVLRVVHDYVTYPRIVRGSIHLHPLAIILSVLAGEQIAGIPGVFLSIPIVAIATVLYKHILEHYGGKGLLSGFLEPKKDEVAARLVEDKSVEPEKIEEKIEVREAKKEEVKEVVRDAVNEIKKVDA